MSRYKKRQLEVDAEQFSLSAHKAKPHPGIRRCVIADNKVECLLNDQERFPGTADRYASHAIQTTRGWVEIRDGDWIIKEIDTADHYPCSNEVFIRTYEAAL